MSKPLSAKAEMEAQLLAYYALLANHRQEGETVIDALRRLTNEGMPLRAAEEDSADGWHYLPEMPDDSEVAVTGLLVAMRTPKDATYIINGWSLDALQTRLKDWRGDKVYAWRCSIKHTPPPLPKGD